LDLHSVEAVDLQAERSVSEVMIQPGPDVLAFKPTHLCLLQVSLNLVKVSSDLGRFARPRQSLLDIATQQRLSVRRVRGYDQKRITSARRT
jgi:hypothetical protein